MKIRILANTISFRLRQSEAQLFLENGSLTSVTKLGPGPADQIGFCLAASEEAELTGCF